MDKLTWTSIPSATNEPISTKSAQRPLHPIKNRDDNIILLRFTKTYYRKLYTYSIDPELGTKKAQ